MPADLAPRPLRRLIVQHARSMCRIASTVGIAAFLAGLPVSCAPARLGPYQPAVEAQRDSYRASTLTREAVELLDRQPPPTPETLTRAERLLREALTADLYHGPAHNNLGVVFLLRGQLYEAANEFEWARKLLPGNADPRMNLGMVLETAERTDDALAAYRSALEAEPEHVPAMQAMVRLQVRRDRTDERTNDLLKVISLRGESERWREWARTQLAQRDGRSPPAP